ncbi:hypothetical protein NUU61_003254 [Penicillium alfredii]|uniref:Uncharacterized protein n=1 Tax=Penicillium alfredii TaxID=1506179 RepID=A0A9W9FU93_9EURO|nr:uncharacterized protein NUU61_003254 [Penicillium alfredii]KAJ5105907.1 hypothetical protein NUU61_003254 [Penicillium alfredii]
MQYTSMPFSPVKDGRRILGEKDSNACLSPVPTKHSVAGTPVKRTLPAASPKKLLPSPIFAGQKRTRDQVDEVDVNVNSGHVQRDLLETRTSSTTQYARDSTSRTPDATETRVPPQHFQPERDQTEEQIDPERLSKASDDSESTQTVPADPNARKMFIQQKATLLRSRLQSAMRNVPDHQFDRRVSELDAHSRKCAWLSSALSTPSLAKKAYTPSQIKTPRLGSAADLSSTPLQSTPDLPGRPSPMATSFASTKTPAQRTPPRPLGSPMQLSSPPATVVRHGRDREPSPNAEAEDEPTHRTMSPSQRGDAVDGLLKLMNTADRHDRL